MPPAGGARGGLKLLVEGPCPELSVHAVGPRRFVVYGDTGYDLHAWMPGDPVAAAQAIVEIADGRAFFNPAMSAGLPTDARGYVPGSLELGGDFASGAWLLRTTTRYAEGGRGALFDRSTEGFLFGGHGWRRTGEPVALPEPARKLPELPADACPDGLRLIPLAWEPTPAGGVVVAGRCDDDKPANLGEAIVMVAHGKPGADAWSVERVEDTDALDGIINVDLDARGDDDVYLVAYEPFLDRDRRQSFVAHYDGARWRALDWPINDGLMSIAHDRGETFIAGGRALYHRSDSGEIEKRDLPALRYSNAAAEQLHVHGVSVFAAGDLWVEASYRVNVPDEGGRRRSVWASALFTNSAARAPLYCDAREPAEVAIYEVEP